VTDCGLIQDSRTESGPTRGGLNCGAWT